MISNEHPESFERFRFDPTLAARVADAHARLAAATTMHVTSAAGTDLTVRLAGAVTAGSTGMTDGPGSIAHWPGGLVLAFPAPGTVEGTVVLAPGDINLTFKRYVERPVALTIADDHIIEIAGDGVDADLFRSYLSAFAEAEGDRSAYACSHVGWGLNQQARWDYLELYDKGAMNGTEARAFAGGFLYSTGANEVADRFTAGHFDLPMRGCTVRARRPAGGGRRASWWSTLPRRCRKVPNDLAEHGGGADQATETNGQATGRGERRAGSG